VQDGRVIFKCVLAKRLDVEVDSGPEVFHRDVSAIALADDTAHNPKRVCNEAVFALLNDDFVFCGSHCPEA
jgi:hypothetical protein